MPTTKPGRDLINQYLKENHIGVRTLAKVYGIDKGQISKYLSGEIQTKNANKFITQLIQDYGI
ncbi:MAG TPA: XRE family transcriptional regulator [Companilactobacillus farciminis]|uniref:XRE family transcriptional regulator n=1 Tax=Companilactobacillus farciminis TaxID=1612 RepID=A0A921L9Y5_9LACO|nr:transcriptional regulator [Lactobacillus johnsonii]HJF87268.1 XRE family transcriptional regulator [Companilactobacillus farciminis]